MDVSRSKERQVEQNWVKAQRIDSSKELKTNPPMNVYYELGQPFVRLVLDSLSALLSAQKLPVEVVQCLHQIGRSTVVALLGVFRLLHLAQQRIHFGDG